jgi:signal transduction histidine kinase
MIPQSMSPPKTGPHDGASAARERVAPDFELLFRAAPSLLLVLSPDPMFRIVGASDAYVRASRTSREAILGKPFFEVFPETVEGPRATGMGSLRAALERVLATRKPDALNAPVIDDRGELRYVIHRADAMELEVLRCSQERDDALHQLRNANEELEGFSQAVATDLRAPMRAIDSFINLYRKMKGTNLDDGIRRLFTRITARIAHMDGTVEDLLEISRVARARITRSRVDISAIARDIVGEWAAREPEREVELEIASGMEAWADPDLVRTMLEHLVDNAWKFTAARTPARIEIGCRIIVGQRVFHVRDNGTGFDMAQTDRLFAPFARLHVGAEDGADSSRGVGLAIVKRIVQRHGGEIWAEAVPGQGAAFHFTVNGGSAGAAP